MRKGGREGGREGGRKRIEKEKVYWENKKLKRPMRREKRRKGKQQESKRRRPYLIPKRSFFASPCADMISTCKHICVQKDEKQSTSVL